MYYIIMIQDYICNCSTESGLQLKTTNPFCEILSVVTLVMHSVHCSCSLRSMPSTHRDSLSHGKTPTTLQEGREYGRKTGKRLGQDNIERGMIPSQL